MRVKQLLHPWLLVVYALYLCAALIVVRAFYQQHLRDELSQAVRKGDSAEVRALLERGIPPDASKKGETPPLAVAIARGDTKTALLLIRAGARGVPDDYLCSAIRRENISVLRELVDRGADVSATCRDSTWTPLMTAALSGNERIVAFLLDHGANPTYVLTKPGELQGETALTRAVFNGNTRVVRLLLERGANPNVRFNAVGRVTPLMVASMVGAVDVARLLLAHHADVNARDAGGNTAYRIAMAAWKREGCKPDPNVPDMDRSKSYPKLYVHTLALLKQAGGKDLGPSSPSVPTSRTSYQTERHASAAGR